MVWFGSGQAQALQLLQLTYSTCAWLCCEPAVAEPPPHCEAALPTGSEQASVTGVNVGPVAPPLVVPQQQAYLAACCTEGLAAGTQALLKRRYYLVEKAKEASIVGILVRQARPETRGEPCCTRPLP